MNITEPYFTSIPPQERNSVKYLISDMYNPYISYVDKYFPNAVPVVDSFHVLQWVTRSIDNYMRQLLKKYKQRDRERQEQLTSDPLHPVQLPISDEVYILPEISLAYPVKSVKYPLSLRSSHGPALSRSNEHLRLRGLAFSH